MSSKRDLVEAHAFNRRRLTTAFTSGAPGGREVEGPRHGRTLIGGAVLAVMVVAGAAVTGFLKPTAPPNWDQTGLVIGKESGSRFVASNGTLYPVINTTSARLLLNPDDFKANIVPDDRIAKRRPAHAIGIVGAPDVLPAADSLVQTGWSACVDARNDGRVRLAGDPKAIATPDQAVLVGDGQRLFLVAGGRRHEIKDEAAVRGALDLGNSRVWATGTVWLNLFAPGEDLEPVSVPGQGAKAQVDGLPADAQTIGQLVSSGDATFVVLRDKIAEVSPLQVAMLQAGPKPVAGGSVLAVTPADVAAADKTDPRSEPTVGSSWPKALPGDVSDTAVCALLTHQGPNHVPVVSLAVPDEEEAFDGPAMDIQSGHGAVARTFNGEATDVGTDYLIDSTGMSYALLRSEGKMDPVTLLGYGDLEPALVPPSWLELFKEGPKLSTALARKPVETSQTAEAP